MSNYRALDFSLLHEPESMGLLIRFPLDIDESLRINSALSEVHDRARASLHFLVGGVNDESWLVEASLRAGLNEFYSLEDAANRVFRIDRSGKKAPAITDSKHPLVHAMYALRHINVHVTPTSTRREAVRGAPGRPVSFLMAATLLDDDTALAVTSTTEVKKYYGAGEMTRVVSWLLQAQKAFGIGAVLRLGLEQYCREILVAFKRDA